MDHNLKNALILAIKIAWNEIIAASESESDKDELSSDNDGIIEKNWNYKKISIPRFDDQQFKKHYKLNKGTFNTLYRSLRNVHDSFSYVHPGQPTINLEKQVLMTLWYLANAEGFGSIAERFGVGTKTCWQAIFKVCKYLLAVNKNEDIIRWPNVDEAKRTISYFKNKTKFPGVIGCIGGSHITIAKPKHNPKSYVNRKNVHSVWLQGVCDEEMKFTDCYAGEAGSINDSCVFRRSNLFKKITEGTIQIADNRHLLGDQGYGLKTYLLTPFMDCENLTPEQKIYNHVHSSIRMTIKKAFGLLKARFQRLHKLNIRRPEYIPQLIISCCILHNFCIRNYDVFEESLISIEQIEKSIFTDSVELSAQRKRNTIVRALNS